MLVVVGFDGCGRVASSNLKRIGDLDRSMKHSFETFRSRVENADLETLNSYFGELQEEAAKGDRDVHHYLGISVDSKGSIGETNLHSTGSSLQRPPGNDDILVELQTATAENYSRKEVLELIRSKVMDETMSLITRMER